MLIISRYRICERNYYLLSGRDKILCYMKVCGNFDKENQSDLLYLYYYRMYGVKVNLTYVFCPGPPACSCHLVVELPKLLIHLINCDVMKQAHSLKTGDLLTHQLFLLSLRSKTKKSSELCKITPAGKRSLSLSQTDTYMCGMIICTCV